MKRPFGQTTGTLLLAAGLMFSASGCRSDSQTGGEAGAPETPPVNQLSESEAAEGWVLLFNGEDLNQWRGFRMDQVPPGWEVSEGTVFFNADHGGEGHGDLMTRDQFDNFELRLEWKISPGGNSGILYRVSEDFEQEYMTGPEMQIIDGSKEHYPELNDDQQAGANYGLHAAARDVVKPVGEWNSVRLIVNGSHVEHWMNGEKLLEYELWTEEWKQMVAQSKFVEWPGYGLNRTGYIVLQDHGAPVWYRNVKIKRLG